MPTQREALRKKHEEQKRRQNIIIAGVAVVVLAIIAWIVFTVQANNSRTSEIPTQAVQPTDIPQSTPVPGPTVNGKQYSAAPPMTIDPKKQYFATVKMAKGGEFVIQLFPDKAPIAVNSFVFLARDGFYNGTTFHRVLEGFMAQGGDPTGTGGGGPGYEFNNELNDLAFDKPGVVAMANAGPNTNGSQFFIMFGPYGLSEKDYTIFGQVTEGMEVVNGITRRDPDTGPTFTGDAIESITISEK